MVNHKLWRSPYLSACLLVGGAALMGPHGNLFVAQTLHQFWLAAGVMGAGFMLSWALPGVSAVWFWAVAIATRLLLLPMEPGDDVWRYLWEGKIQFLGFSPYEFAPNAPELAPYRPDWWPLINHPDVSAIYPPITQLGFRLLAAISPNLHLFKLAFVLPDLLVCWLLARRFSWASATLYAWNPMVIYAFAGGAHYDSWLILPLVAAWFLCDRHEDCSRPGDELGAACLVGISVAVKWISLPLLAFLLWRSLRQGRIGQTLAIAVVGMLPLVLSALPFCHGFPGQLTACSLIPTESNFVTAGRSAEWIPYWVGKFWPSSLAANWIYGLPLALWAFWLLLRFKRFGEFAEWYWFGLLNLTPIVHFWYFTWIVPFAVPRQNLGVRLVSLSAFVYFVLLPRKPVWVLTEGERLLLWLPLVLGWLWTTCRPPQTPSPSPPQKADRQERQGFQDRTAD
ncbi:MAG: hypothetical protein HC890_11660 [Chloroflexaceae bacterium]|nr:hypothetical protein [Chloroflexaceae bacterium]